MRFHTRAFLFSFIPFAVLLTLSFFLVQSHVQSTVREGLRDSLRQSQRNVAQLRDVNKLQNSQSLRSAVTDADLLSTVQSVAAPGAAAPTQDLPVESIATEAANATAVPNPLVAKTALEEQLLRIGVHAGHDLLIVTGLDGKPLAGAVRAGGGSAELVPLYVFPEVEDGGLLLFRGEAFQTGTVPLTVDGKKLGSLTVGERLNLSLFATSAVLLHHGRALRSNVSGLSLLELGTQLGSCPMQGECDVKLDGNEWMALPILQGSKHNGWTLHSLVNVDAATAPVSASLRKIFLSVALLALITTLCCSFLASRAVVQPIAMMVAHLRHTAHTGTLPEFEGKLANVAEVKELARSYNQAATAVKGAQGGLQNAYVEFVYALANALDARDRYTAGHSKRVSDLSCKIAVAMGLSEEDIERLRIGALLHDIGKIGVSDMLLQKPGRLTDEEFKAIKKHPVVGRSILQSVQGFAKYLPAVELHHENWDGTGYPKRQRGQETPIDARIIHVADAYDAMTTDRSYRPGMTHDRALDILAENAGIQFDPDVVAALMAASAPLNQEAPPAGIASPATKAVPHMEVTVPEVVLTKKQVPVELIHDSQLIEFAATQNYPVC